LLPTTMGGVFFKFKIFFILNLNYFLI